MSIKLCYRLAKKKTIFQVIDFFFTKKDEEDVWTTDKCVSSPLKIEKSGLIFLIIT